MAGYRHRLLVIDIETGADDEFIRLPEVQKAFREHLKAPKNYKKEETIAKWKEDQVAAFPKKAALDPLLCRVRCIGIGEMIYGPGPIHEDNLEPIDMIADEDETVVLELFCRRWDNMHEEFKADPVLLGKNIRRFDLPVLLARMAVCGIYPTTWFPYNPRDYRNLVDLQDYFAFENLAWLCHRFGLPQPLGTGKDALDMDLPELMEHCKRDIYLTRELFRRNWHRAQQTRQIVDGYYTGVQPQDETVNDFIDAMTRDRDEALRAQGLNDKDLEIIRKAREDAADPTGRSAGQDDDLEAARQHEAEKNK